jgi:hypothetical protein
VCLQSSTRRPDAGRITAQHDDGELAWQQFEQETGKGNAGTAICESWPKWAGSPSVRERARCRACTGCVRTRVPSGSDAAEWHVAARCGVGRVMRRRAQRQGHTRIVVRAE